MWSCWPERATRTTRFSRTRLCLGTTGKWPTRSCAREVLKGPDRPRRNGTRQVAVRAVRHGFGNRLAGSRTRASKPGLRPGHPSGRSCQKRGEYRLLLRADFDLEEPCRPVSTKQTLGYAHKANLLRHLCGGRLHRWLTFWRRGRVLDSILWPGWPASRLILAQYVPASCSWRSTDRVMTDTITLPAR